MPEGSLNSTIFSAAAPLLRVQFAAVLSAFDKERRLESTAIQGGAKGPKGDCGGREMPILSCPLVKAFETLPGVEDQRDDPVAVLRVVLLTP